MDLWLPQLATRSSVWYSEFLPFQCKCLCSCWWHRGLDAAKPLYHWTITMLHNVSLDKIFIFSSINSCKMTIFLKTHHYGYEVVAFLIKYLLLKYTDFNEGFCLLMYCDFKKKSLFLLESYETSHWQHMSPLKIFSTFSIGMQKEPDSTPHTRNEQDEVLDVSSVTGREQQVGKTCSQT